MFLKKISLKRFSLQRQLVLIFSILALLVIAILFPLVDKNLSGVIDQEMYEVLENAQYIYTETRVWQIAQAENKQVYHGVFYPTVRRFDGQGMSEQIYTEIMYAVNDDLETMMKNNSKLIESKNAAYEKDLYYRIQYEEEYVESTGNTIPQYVISAIFSDYSSTLVTSFKQQVIYLFYGALAIIAIILFIWVTSLIKPLRAIKRYIDDIKEDKNSELTIDRDDEIGVLSRGLVSMKSQLDEQSRVKEEMIHNISHDLKTPIALIQTYSQSVKDGIYPYGDKESSMDVIIENTERLDRKVRSLLYMNRLDYLRGEGNNEDVDMRELIEHIASQFLVMHPDIELQLELDYIEFIGNEEHWRVCIENIMENAYRYVDSKIEIFLRENYLEIYNDGDAIENENIDALFQPYEKGTKGQFGLGLSIVFKTVSLYGYTVKAVNREKGVSFIIQK